jgi:hypothetical protein
MVSLYPPGGEEKSPVSLTYPPNITPATMNFPCCHLSSAFKEINKMQDELSAQDHLSAPDHAVHGGEACETGERPDYLRSCGFHGLRKSSGTIIPAICLALDGERQDVYQRIGAFLTK